MRLLVTRPQPDAARTAAALAALGHETMIAPLLEAELLPPPADLLSPAAVLVTSINAVRAIAAWPAARLPRDRPLLAVGDRTADAARAAGFADIRSAAGDAGALAALAGETLDPGAGPLLYPAADRPAGDLAGLLRRSGFTVIELAAYRMAPVTRLPDAVAAALESGALDGVLLYSRRTAMVFATLAAPLGPHLAAMPLYCLSAEVASGVGFGRVAIAAAPNEAALFALIGAGTSAAGNH